MNSIIVTETSSEVKKKIVPKVGKMVSENGVRSDFSLTSQQDRKMRNDTNFTVMFISQAM